MKNARKHTSFRLDPDVINNIKILQSIYTNQIGFKVSQSDVITLLVSKEVERIEKETKENLNAKEN